MTTAFQPLLGIHFPSLDLLLIFAFAASLPTAFFLWIRWWLGSIKDENPDQAIAEQSKADQEHIEHHGHGHGHGHSHHHAHA